MPGREKAAAERAPFPAAGCSSIKASRYGSAPSILKPIPAHESALLEAGGRAAYRDGARKGQQGRGVGVTVIELRPRELDRRPGDLLTFGNGEGG